MTTFTSTSSTWFCDGYNDADSGAIFSYPSKNAAVNAEYLEGWNYRKNEK